MQGNLAKIFQRQTEQAQEDRLMFSAGILQVANDNVFTEDIASKLGVPVVVSNHNEFAQLLDNMVNLATDAYVENDLLRLIDLSLEIENIDTILNFQDALGTIVLERLVLLSIGADNLTNMLYEETFDDYHEIVKSKIKTVNTKIGDYLPKKEK